MKLQFLIPQYRETEEMIWPLLTSIALQRRLDFSEIGAIICNDGSDTILSENFLAQFPYRIEYIHAPHGGVSAARNICLRQATADYVMFCDADDMFCSTHELWQALDSLYKDPCDVLVCDYIEEWITSKQTYTYKTVTEPDHTIHGKIFSRVFLMEKQIFWNEKLTNIEDNYFCFLVYSENPKLGQYHYSTYMYCNSEGSITHKSDYNYFSTLDVIKCFVALVEELLWRGNYNWAQCMLLSVYYKIFFITNLEEWQTEEKRDLKTKVEQSFKKELLPYWDLYLQTNEEQRVQLYKETKVAIEYIWHPFIETISFKDWIEYIRGL